MARHNDEPATPANIPHFARPLAPYIKSRQEALHIRQVLTSYLRSHLIFADDHPDHPNTHAQSHLSLCVPQDVIVDVKSIPSDLTGLRREYLQALRANVDAKKEYQSVSKRHTFTKPQGGAAGVETRPVDPNFELQGYLQLLRDRRRHAKLQVFEHYTQELKERGTVRPEDFDNIGSRSQQFVPPPDLEGSQNRHTSEDGIEDLLHNLERAVVRASTQLELERRLLEDLKAQNGTRDGSDSGHATPAAKVAALQQTRDELVHWVEEKLVNVGNNEDGLMQELPAEEIEKSAHLLEDQKAQVAEQYAAYVDARKRLLDVASRACQPIGTSTAKPPSQPTVQSKAITEATSSLEPVDVLSFADKHLLPLFKCQRALALQKFYLSGMLAKQKSTTLRILNRLSDESHLLPEYPILARQPRFKHAAAAINARHATNLMESTKPDEIVTLAEAWAFASEAAGTNEQEYVEQTVEEGIETAQDAEQALQEVYGMLNQDLEEVSRDDQDRGQDGNDIWTYEAQSSKSHVRSSRSAKRTRGPWARVDGRVGITD
ncbi:hypothetical protein BBP40_001111 [Aspergillus hancockii]|nr:hypothetical protein BBP40_001111 [Aspergillus hancockii]